MAGDLMLYAGSIVITLWGVAHIVPTRSVVAGFETLTEDNRRIITMEWVAEGLTLCFIGLLALSITVAGLARNPLAPIVYGACAAMLLIMAVWSALTGAKTPVLPMKLCPFVKTAVAILFVLGSL